MDLVTDDPGADLGVLFRHKDGYSTACGHGTIALGAWVVRVLTHESIVGTRFTARVTDRGFVLR